MAKENMDSSERITDFEPPACWTSLWKKHWTTLKRLERYLVVPGLTIE